MMILYKKLLNVKRKRGQVDGYDIIQVMSTYVWWINNVQLVLNDKTVTYYYDGPYCACGTAVLFRLTLLLYTRVKGLTGLLLQTQAHFRGKRWTVHQVWLFNYANDWYEFIRNTFGWLKLPGWRGITKRSRLLYENRKYRHLTGGRCLCRTGDGCSDAEEFSSHYVSGSAAGVHVHGVSICESQSQGGDRKRRGGRNGAGVAHQTLILSSALSALVGHRWGFNAVTSSGSLHKITKRSLLRLLI